MLEIVVPAGEEFDPRTEEFTKFKEQRLQMEHSLLSISAWEAKHHKPFLSCEKSDEEIMDYIRCMTITKGVDPSVYRRLTNQNFKDINDYIGDSMTATWFAKEEQKEGTVKKKEIITSELIYYYMVAGQIPFSCEKWHINRLLTLIHIYNEKNKQPEKKDPKTALSQRKALNAARKAKRNSHG